MVSTFIDVALTKASASTIVVVCPTSQTADITLTGAGFVDQSLGTAATLAPVQVPLVPNGVTHVQWGP
jgi:hypothetical protein